MWQLATSKKNRPFVVGPTCIEETNEDQCGGQQKVSQVHTQVWNMSPKGSKGSTGFG